MHDAHPYGGPFVGTSACWLLQACTPWIVLKELARREVEEEAFFLRLGLSRRDCVPLTVSESLRFQKGLHHMHVQCKYVLYSFMTSGLH
jgi:hypothetical protein